MMQVSKKIPFEDPNVLMGVRALYIVSNLLIAGIYFYTKMQIDKKRGMQMQHYTRNKPEVARYDKRVFANISLTQT
jgi:hypothetical protein